MKVKMVFARLKRKLVAFSAFVMVTMMCTVPALAAESSGASAVLDPALFDPLVSGMTGNISTVLPKVVVVVALCMAIGITFALFKKHARPS